MARRFKRRGELTVEEMVERGIPLRVAVHAKLGESGTALAEWCRTVGIDPNNVTRLLGGAPVRNEAARVAIVTRFKVNRDWLDGQIAALQG